MYVTYAAGDDIESQRKGMVTIVLPGGPGNAWLSPLKVDARAGHLASKRHEVTPIRCASFHFCMTDNPVYRIIRDFVVLCGNMPNSRMKFHMGTLTLSMIYSYYSISIFVLFGFVSISTTPYVAYHLSLSFSPSLYVLYCTVLCCTPSHPTPPQQEKILNYGIRYRDLESP